MRGGGGGVRTCLRFASGHVESLTFHGEPNVTKRAARILGLGCFPHTAGTQSRGPEQSTP